MWKERIVMIPGITISNSIWFYTINLDFNCKLRRINLVDNCPTQHCCSPILANDSLHIFTLHEHYCVKLSKIVYKYKGYGFNNDMITNKWPIHRVVWIGFHKERDSKERKRPKCFLAKLCKNLIIELLKFV